MSQVLRIDDDEEGGLGMAARSEIEGMVERLLDAGRFKDYVPIDIRSLAP